MNILAATEYPVLIPFDIEMDKSRYIFLLSSLHAYFISVGVT